MGEEDSPFAQHRFRLFFAQKLEERESDRYDREYRNDELGHPRRVIDSIRIERCEGEVVTAPDKPLGKYEERQILDGTGDFGAFALTGKVFLHVVTEWRMRIGILFKAA